MTMSVNGIAMSSNHSLVGLLAMTEQEKIQIPPTPFAKGEIDRHIYIFHCHQMT